MINTIRYGGQIKTQKDGKDIIVTIPGSFILNQTGAFIDVIITHPRVVQEKFSEQGKEIPQLKLKALIDTGASSSVINPKVAEEFINTYHTAVG